MRLINTETLNLEIFDGHPPRYAILSHTWGEEEVLLDDLADIQQATNKQGFVKIKKTCEMARSQGIRYTWVDTCCIDKSSSAELSEAVNSMYRWYQEAAVCYAYLQDLPAAKTPSENDWNLCRWFKRGWTLQELVAPKEVEFYDGGWNPCGLKSSDPVLGIVASITRINKEVLLDSGLVPSISVARKMSWAAGRETRRVEDAAYSLLGLFDVNMPLIYGEGWKAFQRLQEEILRRSTDLSLFAWKAGGDEEFRGIFARSPEEFHIYRDYGFGRSGFECYTDSLSTNRGVFITANLSSVSQPGAEYVMDLGFIVGPNIDLLSRAGIHLVEKAEGFVRAKPRELVTLKADCELETAIIFVCSDIDPWSPAMPELRGQIHTLHHWPAPARRSQTQSTPVSWAVATGNFASFYGTHSPKKQPEDTLGGLTILGWSDGEPALAEGHQFLPFRERIVQAALARYQQWLNGEFDPNHQASPKSESADIAGLTSRKRTRVDYDEQHKSATEFTTYAGEHYQAPFACPFYLKDQPRRISCLKSELRCIPDVAQHLWWDHMRPFYCPNCGQTFTQTRLRDEHIVEQSCAPVECALQSPPEGITSEQNRQIQRVVRKRREFPIDQWFMIWDIACEECPRPRSPYLGTEMALGMSRLRSFWRIHGQEIVSTILESRGLLRWTLLDEERDLEAMVSLVFLDLLRHQVAGHSVALQEKPE